jgi:hypothetical protein
MASIHLQEGFDDDTVVLSVDGLETVRLEHVTTRLLLGYAQIEHLENVGPRCRLTVDVTTRALVGEADIDAESVVVVSIDGDRLVVTRPESPPMYL